MAKHITRVLLVVMLVAISGWAIAAGADEPECAAQPISLDQLNTSIEGEVVPFEESVLADDRGDVTDTDRDVAEDLVRELVACSNAGEPLRVWSLYSDAYLARMFQIQGPFSPELYEANAVPMPAGDEGMWVEEIRDVWKRADGAFGVEVVMTYPSVPMPKRLIVWMGGEPLRIEEITGEISFSVP